MSRLGFIILLLVSSETVFVTSQLTCSRSDDCDSSSCCFQKSCSSDQNICEVLKRIEELKSCTSDYQCSGCCINRRCGQCKSCIWNWQCGSGCCKDYKCQSSYECSSYSLTTTPATQTSCYGNWQCDSGCCKYNKCQPSYVCDSYSHTTPPATQRCYGNWQCDSGCCKYNKCQPSYVCDSYSYTTTEPADDPIYDNNDYDYRSSDSSSSGMSAGAYVGIVIAGVFLVILKLAVWVSWCSRRRRVVVVRRRVTCVAVPIVNHDELQREHERAMQLDRPPPAYSPRPFEDNSEEPPTGPPPVYSRNPPSNENENINSSETAQNQTSGESGNAEGVTNVPQDSIPPPAYSPTPAVNMGQTPISGQAGQAQRAEVIGTINQQYGTISQPHGAPLAGNTITPSRAFSQQPPGNLLPNNTEQNPSHMNPTQRENAVPMTDQSNGDQSDNTIGPFVI